MTVTEQQERLQMYLDAEKAIVEGNQSYTSPDGTTFTRADLNSVQYQIRTIRHEIAAVSGGSFGSHSFTYGG